jgi:hypothetical protein
MRDAAANLSGQVKGGRWLFKEGWNTLTCWTYDTRPFALFVSVAHRRTMEDVRALIPADPRPKDTALQVRASHWRPPPPRRKPVLRHSFLVTLRGKNSGGAQKMFFVQAQNRPPDTEADGARP